MPSLFGFSLSDHFLSTKARTKVFKAKANMENANGAALGASNSPPGSAPLSASRRRENSDLSVVQLILCDAREIGEAAEKGYFKG
jgi:hypothetical protein